VIGEFEPMKLQSHGGLQRLSHNILKTKANRIDAKG